MNKAIVFVGGGQEALPALQRAKDMGLRVVLVDGSEACPGRNIADDFILSSTYDVAGSADKAEAFHREVHPISGCICVASDVPHTVAAIGERLGLATVSTATAALAMDKIRMKDRFAYRGIAIPVYREVFSPDDVAVFLGDTDGAAVIKPADSRGARGVRKINSADDLKHAFEQALAHSPSGRVLVEEFIAGPQFSSEALVVDGNVFNIGLSDRNYEHAARFAPHIIEDGGDLPASLDKSQIREMDALLSAAAQAMEMQTGVLKGDLVWDENAGQMRIIEVATRLSGGYFCTHEIPMSTGFDFVGAAIELALGAQPETPSPRSLEARHVCQRYCFGQQGRIEKMPDLSELAGRPGIGFATLYKAVGDSIVSPASHVDRLGMVIAVGDTREQAQDFAQSAVAWAAENIVIEEAG